MTLQYGYTNAGWVGKPLSQVQSEVDAALQGILGTSAGTNPDGTIPLQSRAGQLKSLLVDSFSSLWDLLSSIVAQLDPNQASGAGLATLCSLTGTLQQAPSPSTVVATLTGVPSTTVPSGSVASVAGTNAQFFSTAAVQLAPLNGWSNGGGSGTAYAAGARVTANGNSYAVMVAGTGATSGGGPSGPGATPYAAKGAVTPGDGQQQQVGDLRFIGGSIYRCTAAGVNAGALDGTQTSTTIPDGMASWTYVTAGAFGGGIQDGTGTLLWQCLGPGTAAADVLFQASAPGAIAADAGTLHQIVTPVYGWQGCNNLRDATIGALLETDAALRVRREEELHAEGGPPIDGIRSAVLKAAVGETGVTTCTVYANNTDATSTGSAPAGLPAGIGPHAVMVVADYDGQDNAQLDSAIAEAIFSAVGAGINTSLGQASGANAFSVQVTDSEGNPCIVNWVRPEIVNIGVTVNVKYDSTLTTFPTPGDARVLLQGGTLGSGAAVSGTIPAFGATYPAGRDVWASAIASAVFDGPTDTAQGAQPLQGVLDVQVLLSSATSGMLPTPSLTQIPISGLQRAVFASTAITVNLTPVTP
jgi:uncharacterized phage protein gp47/JayE